MGVDRASVSIDNHEPAAPNGAAGFSMLMFLERVDMLRKYCYTAEYM